MRPWLSPRGRWSHTTILAPAPFVLWAIFFALRGQLRWEQLAMALAAVGLAYGSAQTRRFYFAMLPMGILGLVYDGMRFVHRGSGSAANVHVCDLRDLELRYFGVASGGRVITWPDYFYENPSLALDVFCAVPYGTFLFVSIGYGIFLYFRGVESQQRFAWGFLLVNLLGFLTYRLYPAAPPWYFHEHGCVVDLAVPASQGTHLARVDELLGVGYFAGMYARSSNVFGAMPSLHVAYPLLMLLEGWKHHGKLGKAALAGFYAWMCFSAVYLDHHWVLDVVAGSFYALVVALGLRKLIANKSALPVAARKLRT